MQKDPRKIDIYYAVGEAIHQWGVIENEVNRVFITIVGGGQLHTFGAVSSISKIQSFRNRLEVVDAAISAYGLPEDLRQKWESLHAKLGKKNKARNEIAHFGIVEEGNKLVLRPFNSRGSHTGKLFTEIYSNIKALPEPNTKAAEQASDEISQKIKGKSLGAEDIWLRATSFKKLKENISDFNEELEEYSMFVTNYMQNEGATRIESYLVENHNLTDTQNSQPKPPKKPQS